MQERPEWFSARAAQSSLWATDVRVLTFEDVEQMARAWTSSETGALMRYLWGAFLGSEAHFRERLPSVAWDRLGPWQLVQFLHVGTGVARGIEDSTREIDLSGEDRARLYFHAVLVSALAHAWRAGLVPAVTADNVARLRASFAKLDRGEPATFDEVPAVRWAVMTTMVGAACHAAAPHLVPVIRQRGAGHVGFNAAVLALLGRAEQWGARLGLDVDRDAERAADTLAGEARKAARQLPLPRDAIRDLVDALRGQAALTVGARWGDVDPLELLARSLHGELDVAPAAIRDDLHDSTRRSVRRQRWEFLFGQPPPDAEGADGEPWDPTDPEALSPAAWAEIQEVGDRVLADSALTAYVKAAADADTQAEVAARLGCSVRTVKRLRAKLLDLLA